MNQEYAKYLLDKTVDDYNKIADKFSSTRNYISEDVMNLKKYAKDGDYIFDLGCGNGRLTALFEDLNNARYLGGDSSSKLVEIAREKHPDKDFIVLDPIRLDIADDTFDIVYCLAVFHHIPDTSLRIKYLKEIKRVLKQDGLLVLSVWNFWAKPGIFWQIVKNGIFHPKLDLNDIFLPFKDGSGKVLASRYMHCFKKSELEKLFLEAGLRVHLIETQKRGMKNENENFLVIAQK